MAFPATGWTDRGTNDLGPGQIYTSITATAQYDNVIALTQGATGAPRIQHEALDIGIVEQDNIAASAVGQSQLKSTSGTVSSTSTSNMTAPGGQYTLSYETRLVNSSINTHTGTSSVGVSSQSISGGGDTGYVNRVNVSGSNADVRVYVRTTYIQSSPPYDHGDGVVYGYVYAEVDSQGLVLSTYVSEDPPWYGNTRHSPRSIYKGKNGKEYGKFRKPACCIRDVKEGRISFDEFKARWGECETVEEEITTETKLRGMDQMPQPFQSIAGVAPVLLDPMGELTGRIIRMMQAGESPEDLFSEEYLRVDNTCLDKRCGPPGVPIHAAKWRNS